MPQLHPIAACCFSQAFQPAQPGTPADISTLIAPPYDVLDEGPKRELLARDPHNIVAIDLPFTPPKVVGPDRVYQQAGDTFRLWQQQGVLVRRPTAAIYVYQQSFTYQDQIIHRRGIIANLKVQDFGPCPTAGLGGVWAHEATFASGKEDRLKLMRACAAQLSPIFGLYRDSRQEVSRILTEITRQPPTFAGTTASDQVLHSVWEISDPALLQQLLPRVEQSDVYIADGHHRYNTAINYLQEQLTTGSAPKQAHWCMFVLVAMEDPGMIVLPTHRVLTGLDRFRWDALARVMGEHFSLKPFTGGNLATLEASLPRLGAHAIGLYVPSHPQNKLWVATTLSDDPLASTHADHHPSWRKLDVAIVQHLLVEQIVQPTVCSPGVPVGWKFPHELAKLKTLAEAAEAGETRLGVIVQPTPLASVMDISQAGELMPQKSTFFYPKLATGLVINPLV